ncbi:MAG: DUF6686 family protein [Saprospiraceae bacterium]|nr:DUF6686 family protein [Saprospiraceae bacterium]
MLSNKDYQLLHLNSTGYVVQCVCCDHFQVAFGNTLLVFTHQELSDFFDKITMILETSLCDKPNVKLFQFPTATPSVILAFTLNELKALTHLIEQAVVRKDVDIALTDLDLV